MYVNGTCANIATQILTSPQRAAQFNKSVCYNTVFRILKEADPNFCPNKAQLGHNDVSATLFGPAIINQAINAKNTRPVADSVVGIFKRSSVGTHAFDVNHVAICIDAGGACISTNNGPVGGGGNYSQFNVVNAFVWTPNQWPVYNDPLNPTAPAWARERMVVFRQINQILR